MMSTNRRRPNQRHREVFRSLLRSKRLSPQTYERVRPARCGENEAVAGVANVVANLASSARRVLLCVGGELAMTQSLSKMSLVAFVLGAVVPGCSGSSSDSNDDAASSASGTAGETDAGATISSGDNSGMGSEGGDGDGDADADGGDGDGDSGDGDGDSGDGDGGDGDGDGDGGDGDGDGGDGDGVKFDVGDGIMGDAGGACDEVTVTGEPEPPNIMLILDRSCSMAGQRWTDLQTVVTSLVANYDTEVNFGAQFYPQVVGADVCGVTLDVPVGPMNGTTITNLINGNGPIGLTPTLPAVQTSVTHLQGLMSVGDPVQILIADGDVNECGTATDVEMALSAAYNGGVDLSIPTYAVSVGGTVTQLQNFAVAGGTGNYIETSDLTSLNAAIDAIVEGVLSCKIALDPPPEWPEDVEVSVGGMVYPQLANAAACGDGWYYTTPAKDELELCGAACDQLKITFQADIAYKCPQN